MVQITNKEREFDPIPNGVYLAKITKIVEKVSEKHPEWGPQLVWTFQLLEEPYKKRLAWGRTPNAMGKRLAAYFKALGVDLPMNSSLNTDELVGMVAKVVVKTKDGSTFPNVEDIWALNDADIAKLKSLSDEATVRVAKVESAPAPVSVPVQRVQPTEAVRPAAPAPAATPAPQASPVTPPRRTIPF